MEKIKAKNIKIDYLSICSPNYLHDAHIRMGLRWGANAICEKPLVLNPWNLDALAKIESEYEKKIFTVGLAFSCQKYSGKLPIDKNDKKIDSVLTEKGFKFFDAAN